MAGIRNPAQRDKKTCPLSRQLSPEAAVAIASRTMVA
jgi:hypothetical protein